jgi:hypothetical protein
VAPATRSRRPLPRRVYWFRRLLVLGVAFALVLGIAELLDYSTGNSGGEQAAPVAAAPSSTAESSAGPRKQKPAKPRMRDEGREKDRLARPDGPCEDSDVLVTPTITDAHAGSPVKIVLEVTTVRSAACWFEVSPETVFVNIDGESGTIWSSQHCPEAVPTKNVVPRRERAARVPMWWDGKESEEGCPVWRPWIDVLGGYTAVAAVRGSVTPVAIGFFLGGAVAPTVTETATPTPTPERRKKSERSGTPEPSGKPQT